jgi:dUTP pyrophosphatase
MINVKIELDDLATMPEYAHDGDAGCDLCAAIEHPITIYPGERKLIPVGLRMEIPNGYELQIRPRSGLALKHGITVLNAPGTIDSGYRGMINVLLFNADDFKAFTVEKGMRIAQGVFAAVERPAFSIGGITTSSRGEGGFGSTGTMSGVGYES